MSKSKKDLKGDKKIIIISVLSSVLGCVVLFLIIAFATGMIRFGDARQGDLAGGAASNVTSGTAGGSTESTSTTDDGAEMMDNPNPKVAVKNANLVSVGNLEFYLPSHFEKGSEAGGSSESETVYNLMNDDGWADVRIYVEKSSKDARDYLLAKNSNLTIEQDAWVINDWSWSTAYAAEGAIQAWATNYGDYVYAIILTVKLDSDESNEAAMMIPKTLYFTKIYK